MSDRSATTVRIPTSRLRPAVEAAIEAWARPRWAKVETAVVAAMAPPSLAWWERLLCIDASAPLTRDQAMEKIKTPRSVYGRSEYDRIWSDYHGEWSRLSALSDACSLGLDAVDVSVDDVRWFKAYFTPDDKVYR